MKTPKLQLVEPYAIGDDFGTGLVVEDHKTYFRMLVYKDRYYEDADGEERVEHIVTHSIVFLRTGLEMTEESLRALTGGFEVTQMRFTGRSRRDD